MKVKPPTIYLLLFLFTIIWTLVIIVSTLLVISRFDFWVFFFETWKLSIRVSSCHLLLVFSNFLVIFLLSAIVAMKLCLWMYCTYEYCTHAMISEKSVSNSGLLSQGWNTSSFLLHTLDCQLLVFGLRIHHAWLTIGRFHFCKEETLILWKNLPKMANLLYIKVKYPIFKVCIRSAYQKM